ncbi:MAG: phosphoribosylamine--glycine ligase, partial [Synergistes sp.]|nr:phosphoribosylamine--glycine ligase [Synergistes sp.]
ADAEWPGAARVALGVVMASGGYPGTFEKGLEITGTDEEDENTFVYHAGTKINAQGKLVTNGGRVLTVVGMADDLKTARDLAYARVGKIHFDKCHFRNDIGDKSLKAK